MGASGETALARNLAAPSSFHSVSFAPIGLADVDGWFRAIPSERVGLNGEYDYHGLAKRVSHRFRQALGTDLVSGLSILQRGRVVILHGRVANQDLLNQLVQLAMQESGTDYVELRGVILQGSP